MTSRKIKTLLAFLFIILIQRCTSYSLNIDSRPMAKHIVIFVPGFFGSELVRPDANNDLERIWIDARNALSDHHSLALPNFGLPAIRNLRAGNVLRQVTIVPGLLRYNIYADFLDQFKDDLKNQAQVLEFAYDWRQSIPELARKFHKFVQKIRRKSRAGTQISVVSHSMGGLIVAWYLRYGKQNVAKAKTNWHGQRLLNKIVIAVAPFRGTVSIFKDFFVGIPIAANRSLLTARAVATFPASYELIDRNGVLIASGTRNKKVQKIDPLHLPLWKKHRWGLMSEKWPKQTIKVRNRRLRRALENAERYQQLMLQPSKSASKTPKKDLLHVVGVGRKTAGKVIWEKTKHKIIYHQKTLKIFRAKYDSEAMPYIVKGDGMVTRQSARLPSAIQNNYNVTQIKSTFAHPEVFEDPAVRRSVVDFLLER